jgi:hypothetical protein
MDEVMASETNVEEDKQLLDDFYAVEAYTPERLTPWLLRLVLDDRLTVDKHITMEKIQTRISEEYEVRQRGRGGYCGDSAMCAAAVCCQLGLDAWVEEGRSSCWRSCGSSGACHDRLTPGNSITSRCSEMLLQGLLDVVVVASNDELQVKYSQRSTETLWCNCCCPYYAFAGPAGRDRVR